MMMIAIQCLPVVGSLSFLRPPVNSQAAPMPMSTSRTTPLTCPPPAHLAGDPNPRFFAYPPSLRQRWRLVSLCACRARSRALGPAALSPSLHAVGNGDAEEAEAGGEDAEGDGAEREPGVP